MGRNKQIKKFLDDRGASWTTVNESEVVDHFGDPSAEYQALAEGGLGLMERGERETLVMHGEDAVGWLQGLVTSDVHALVEEGSGQRTTLVNTTGRFVGEARLLHVPELLLFDLEPSALGGGLLSHIRRQIIIEKVKLDDRSRSTGRLTLIGEGAPALLERLGDWTTAPGSLPLFYGAWARWKREDLIVQRVAWSELLSFDIFASPEAIAKLLPVLEEMEPDLNLIGHQAFETLRIETGIPRFKKELHEKVIPLEAGFEDAIAFEKGCYLGQEIIARLDTLGTPAKMLRRVIFEGDEIPEKGTPVHKSDGEGRKIGDVESAVYSPRFEAPVALAFVKRKYNEIGAEVQVGGVRGRLKPLWEMK